MLEHLGPYEIHGELGRGAMAVVWRAFDPSLERWVAIKEPMLAPGTSQTIADDLGSRFVREGRAVAKLNHPGIVTIHAAEIYDGRPAIVMELIEGRTLGDMLDGGPLSSQATLSLLDQLLDAVGYAHARGIVHRDIKPDNVFVTAEGRVKLTDFGIAHVGTGATLTQAGTIMGTPGYMAPEQVTGDPVDARADLFAIGVLANEMLTGSNPFGATDGAAPTTVMYRVVHEQPGAIPTEALQGLPANFSAVLATALAKDPADRFADADAFRSALSGGAISSPMTAGGATLASSASAPGRSGISPTALYSIVGLVAGVALVALLFSANRAVPPVAGGGGSSSSASTTADPGAATAASAAQTPHDITSLASVRVSSSISGSGASMLTDHQDDTAWQVHGDGRHQSATFDFGTPVTITGIDVRPGYDKQHEHGGGDAWDRWLGNNRLHDVTFKFTNGASRSFAFTDSAPGIQTVEITPPVTARGFTMVIDDTYSFQYQLDDKGNPNRGGNDTGVSEISVSGYQP